MRVIEKDILKKIRSVYKEKQKSRNSYLCHKKLTWEVFFGEALEEIKAQFPMLAYGTVEEIVKISDYNKVARLYGIPEYELEENEYIMLCDFKSMEEVRNQVLNHNNAIQIAGKTYISKYSECQSGYLMMSTSHVNTGIILVPDSCPLTDKEKVKYFLACQYNAKTEEEKNEIESYMVDTGSGPIAKIAEKGIQIDGMTKITIMESSIGIVTIVTFIAIYLGIIFLIASSAILALKQLTESSDNKQRYRVLQQIGCDEKMIHQALFRQILLFFMMPLVLAVIHSVFGIQFILSLMSGIASKNDLLPSVIVTVFLIGSIYGAYFVATYLESKNIIKESR